MKMKKLPLAIIAITIFNFLLLDYDAQAQASFSPATTFAVGTTPYSVISADFNSDGKTDLAIANHASNNVSVLLGVGTGSFGAATNFAAGSGPRSIISVDFNQDGKADLAVANEGSGTVSILLGNGSGIFNTALNFPIGVVDSLGNSATNALSITSADFNGDSIPDLATSNSANNISVLLGDGVGSFGTVTNFTTGDFPIKIVSADFNTDGKADLATANLVTNNVSILLGDGTGSFGTTTNFAAGSSPSSLAKGDFNGDGKTDLATANQGNNKVAVLIGNGVGSFAAPASFTVGNAPFSVTSDDFNADGKADLAVSNSGSSDVSVLLGNGLGSFGSASNFNVGTSPMSITSGDFNGDGKKDLAVGDFGDNDVSILINTFIPVGPPICLVTVDSTLSHNLLVWEKTNLNLSTIDSFIVYREITTNNYQRIGAVSKDSLSIFNDLGANPATTGYRYKLKSKNAQGVTTLFSDYHNTIYLTNTGANFNWTPYQIENNTTPVSTYNIYRDNISDGNFILIGNTTGNQFGFTDIQYSSFPNSQYYVEAVMAGGVCQPTRTSFATSRSNLKHIGMRGIQQFTNNSSIIIYPNPSTNVLNITGIKEKTIIRLYDVVGKLVLEKEVENNTTINTSIMTEGVYTLLTENKVWKTFNKVVINR